VERVLQTLNRLKADGVVDNYAIGGGIAAIYYIEPYQTDDIDIFVPVSAVMTGESGLISLERIYSYLTSLGHQPVKEGVLIEDWLVQFIPTFHSVQVEALRNARTVSYGQTNTSIFAPEYLAAELLRSGRLKDLARVEALMESGKIDEVAFHEIIERHGLAEKWQQFAKWFDQQEE
jgi:hypothetical protein